MNRFVWLINEIRWIIKRCYRIISKKEMEVHSSHYGKYDFHSAQDGNIEIARRIAVGQPFAFCRFSFAEMDVMI